MVFNELKINQENLTQRNIEDLDGENDFDEVIKSGVKDSIRNIKSGRALGKITHEDLLYIKQDKGLSGIDSQTLESVENMATSSFSTLSVITKGAIDCKVENFIKTLNSFKGYRQLLDYVKQLYTISILYKIYFSDIEKNFNNDVILRELLTNKLLSILDKNHIAISLEEELFRKYFEFRSSSADLSLVDDELIQKAYRNQGEIAPLLDINGNLNEEAFLIVGNIGSAIDSDYYQKILNGQFRARTKLTASLLRLLRKDQVSGIDLKQLGAVDRIEDVPIAELLKEQPDIINKLKQLIAKEFPGNSAEEFKNEAEHNKHLELTISMIDGELVCFFGKEKRAENIYYMDWFIANSSLDVKGLGEATIRLAFDDEHEKAATHYAVAKPHVKSYELVIEKFGFVGSGGSTSDEEYHDHYARVRRLPSDESFASKQLTKEKNGQFLILLQSVCLHDHLDFSELNNDTADNYPGYKSKIHEVYFEGLPLRVCKVQFPKNYNHHTDVLPNSPDGWFYKELDLQTKQGWVLTRYIKAADEANMNTYYAVFEKDKADPKMKNDLQAVIDQEIQAKVDYRSDHSVSKKTLRS